MKWLKKRAVQYHIIEENVDKEISYDEATQIALRCFSLSFWVLAWE